MNFNKASEEKPEFGREVLWKQRVFHWHIQKIQRVGFGWQKPGTCLSTSEILDL